MNKESTEKALDIVRLIARLESAKKLKKIAESLSGLNDRVTSNLLLVVAIIIMYPDQETKKSVINFIVEKVMDGIDNNVAGLDWKDAPATREQLEEALGKL